MRGAVTLRVRAVKVQNALEGSNVTIMIKLLGLV